MPDRIVILGSGAIGGLAGAYLTRAGRDVVLVDPWFHHIERIKRVGLSAKVLADEFIVRPTALHIDQLGTVAPIDVLLLALKSYDTEWAMRYAAPYLSRGGFVVSLQNGINEETIAGIVGRERTVGGVTHLAAVCPEPGVVVGTSGPSWKAYSFGELDGRASARVDALVAMLGIVGRTNATDDIFGLLWSKLTLNVMTNALSGLTGFTIHQLWSDPKALRVMVHLGGEAILAAEARGYRVIEISPPGAGPVEHLGPEMIKAAHAGDRVAFAQFCHIFETIAGARVGTQSSRASLLQDILKGRRTEVDYLNGYVVRAAAASGLPRSANTAIVEALRPVESGQIGPSAENLERLASLPEAVGQQVLTRAGFDTRFTREKARPAPGDC